MTGQEAKTIHRMLAFDPKTMQFRFNEENPWRRRPSWWMRPRCWTCFWPIRCSKPFRLEAQVLLVGDVDQLPSVGPGMVLRDLIDSQQIPVVRLTQVFRQAATSHIVTNAHRINAGQFHAWSNDEVRRVRLPVAGGSQSQSLVQRASGIW